VLERIDSPGEQQLRFVFPAGGHEGECYAASLSFCPSPTCVCGIVDLSVVLERRAADSASADSKCYFQVDILNRTLDNAGEKTSKYDRNFGKAFVSCLEEQDWALLYELYGRYKRQIYDQARDEELDTDFPESDIERDGAMMDFHEILPFAEPRAIELDGELHVLLDQYCVRMDCGCTETAVNLIAEGDGENILDEYPAVFIDYESGNWRIVERGGREKVFFSQVADTLKAGDYPGWFRDRHSRLKSLYRLYKKRHPSTKCLSTGKKVGRNEPCPCGSGKKYKKCCLGSIAKSTEHASRNGSLSSK